MRAIYAENLKQLVDEEWFDCQEKSSFFDEIDRTPTIDAEPVVRCKDCKYFHYNKVYNIQGFPIMGNYVCDKWANGCRTDENGYCFLGERREDAEIN